MQASEQRLQGSTDWERHLRKKQERRASTAKQRQARKYLTRNADAETQTRHLKRRLDENPKTKERKLPVQSREEKSLDALPAYSCNVTQPRPPRHGLADASFINGSIDPNLRTVDDRLFDCQVYPSCH